MQIVSASAFVNYAQPFDRSGMPQWHLGSRGIIQFESTATGECECETPVRNAVFAQNVLMQCNAARTARLDLMLSCVHMRTCAWSQWHQPTREYKLRSRRGASVVDEEGERKKQNASTDRLIWRITFQGVCRDIKAPRERARDHTHAHTYVCARAHYFGFNGLEDRSDRK